MIIDIHFISRGYGSIDYGYVFNFDTMISQYQSKFPLPFTNSPTRICGESCGICYLRNHHIDLHKSFQNKHRKLIMH